VPEPDFLAFARHLEREGVAPRCAARAAEELAEHFADLVDELRHNGWPEQEASSEAAAQLGSLPGIAAQMARRRELRRWYFRWPWLGRLALPLACIAALPLAPVISGVQHREVVVRWSFAMLASAVFTASLLGIMQLSIQLS
jgi:hypothetical protein